MAWFLSKRKREDEWMDRPDVPADQHARALVGLARINVVSRASLAMRKAILQHLGGQPRRLRLTDVACGAGDVPVSVAAQLRRRGFDIQLTLCDRSATALEVARQHAVAAGISNVTILPLDVTRGSLPQADVVTCSLFLHHLDRPEVVAVLKTLQAAAGQLLVVSDIRRSFSAWTGSWLTCFLLTRSPIVHYDGPVSVRAAWTPQELRAMAEEAGMTGAVIALAPGCRMQLVWRR